MTTATALQAAPFYVGKGITLYNARSQEILPLLGPGTIDAIITDPPYATTNLKWDKPVEWKTFWPEAHRICKPKSPMTLFASGKFVIELINSNLKHYRYDLIWEKNLAVGHLSANQRPLRSHENIVFFSQLFKGSTYNPQMTKGKMHSIKSHCPAHYGTISGNVAPKHSNLYHPRSVLRFNNTRDGKSLHPTQKPLDLMTWLVRTYTNRFDTILDPFAGSGSTLVAAAANGRKAIGIEQSAEYCKVIVDRMEGK